MEEENPLLKILRSLEDPKRKDPQRLDPSARWSKETAKAAITAISYYKARFRKGEAQSIVVNHEELQRAERILWLIINSETEDQIKD